MRAKKKGARWPRAAPPARDAGAPKRCAPPVGAKPRPAIDREDAPGKRSRPPIPHGKARRRRIAGGAPPSHPAPASGDRPPATQRDLPPAVPTADVFGPYFGPRSGFSPAELAAAADVVVTPEDEAFAARLRSHYARRSEPVAVAGQAALPAESGLRPGPHRENYMGGTESALHEQVEVRPGRRGSHPPPTRPTPPGRRWTALGWSEATSSTRSPRCSSSKTTTWPPPPSALPRAASSRPPSSTRS